MALTAAQIKEVVKEFGKELGRTGSQVDTTVVHSQFVSIVTNLNTNLLSAFSDTVASIPTGYKTKFNALPLKKKYKLAFLVLQKMEEVA